MADKYDTVSVRMEEGVDVGAIKFEEYIDNQNAKIDAYNKNNKIKKDKIFYMHYGLKKRVPKGYKLSRFVRNTPDYIVVNEDAFLVEVKYFKGHYLWLKIKDVEQYKLWNQKMNLCYFFYSKEYKEHKIVEHKNLMELTATAETKQLPDPNYYDDKLCYSIYWKSI